ncbi:hypothetical protein ZWY2020_002591 [Hordeum vulgare]|nr:hypothetical protein ZWY2020_002591 [Hordeum vulgare]
MFSPPASAAGLAGVPVQGQPPTPQPRLTPSAACCVPATLVVPTHYAAAADPHPMATATTVEMTTATSRGTAPTRPSASVVVVPGTCPETASYGGAPLYWMFRG